MNCPACNVELKMADRQGIEVDYCPKCRGVWLDRGELDKIIERSTQWQSARQEEAREYKEPYEYRHEEREKNYGHKHRRKSMLSEIFDFD
jgi:Zn-finger nucleic acid-binding protein